MLFYPGTDRHYTNQSYGIEGPLASLRLKHWRRGIQDADYLAMANAANPQATLSIVQRMVPKVLWEYGVANEQDPTFVYTDISWSTDPDDWEKARKELADIIIGESAVCPNCSGDDVVIENATIHSIGCECAAPSSITIGPGVFIKSGAKFTLKAPKIIVKAAFHVEEGAVFHSRKMKALFAVFPCITVHMGHYRMSPNPMIVIFQ